MSCVMPGCDRDAVTAWLCSMHYQRLRRLPDVMEEWPTVAEGEPTAWDVERLEVRWLEYRGEKIAGRRNEHMHYTPAERRLICEMRDRGMTLTQIGAAIKRSAASVHRALAAQGRGRVARPYTPRMSDDTARRAIEHRNRTGESWALTREAIGYPGTPEALRRRCMVVAEREGLKLRMGYPAVTRGRG